MTALPAPTSSPFRADLAASLVVFLVAVPLSMGIAVASGAPVMAGLVAAAVGGIVAGYLGGSPLQVSGPAAGLTVIVASLISEFGWRTTCAVTACAGVVQLLLAASRVARAALAISPVVVHAMLAGIGLTIMLQQVHVLLGAASQSTAWDNIATLPRSVSGLEVAELATGLAVIAILIGWRHAPASARRVPGPLVAVVGVTLAAVLLQPSVRRVALDGSILDAVSLPQIPDGAWSSFAIGVLTVALVASVESLLSAVAIDKLHHGPRTDFDRELMGQGAANITSGMVGGLPVTGVIVRSSANVQAGAVGRGSTILHGVWVIAFSIVGVALIEQVPFAALAGLLIVIGAQLVKPRDISLASRTGDLLVYVVTLLGVVFLNLLEGVGIGLALAVVILLSRVVRAQIRVEQLGAERWQVAIEGSCSFLSLPRLTAALRSVPPSTDVVVDLDVDYLDHPASQALSDWADQHRARGGTVTVEEHGHPRLETVDQRPPRRDDEPVPPTPGWQRRTEGSSSLELARRVPHALRPVLDGVDLFHRRDARRVRSLLRPLATSQSPDSLFLTCADSRVVPNLITTTGPGDLFTVRNVGNLVPDHTNGDDTSVDAALAFAVDKLGVTSVVVCGHSGCGAMQALAEGTDDPAIGAWLTHGQQSMTAHLAGHPVGRQARGSGFNEVDQLAMVNVATQLSRLGRHPIVGRAAAAGRVTVAGLFFDIATARVLHVTTTEVIELAPERPAALTTDVADA
ncbi:SulP family inorganic anion transporter [Luteipulveratus mongoliensis]|uniref:carbonic anhydrase n=1 Tax=Luteipulveratus mongoliensis TaxID=571913 RepID=A0A0K1JII8_9MICO|nr:bifunctional SulP family inorganic anion transporter/carbonic anhydrase [Luteipulveratus mongoliensis]AKU16534.1 carbonic anhydrase [Luteipulveratus mongoliensis]